MQYIEPSFVSLPAQFASSGAGLSLVTRKIVMVREPIWNIEIL